MEGEFNYAKELELLAEALTADDVHATSDILDRFGKHCRRLELTVKKQHKEIAKYEAENKELAKQCHLHFSNAQKALRHELHLEEKVLTTKGTVHGTNETFELK